MFKNIIFFFSCSIITVVQAQRVVADQVVAVVGDQPILQSDIFNDHFQKTGQRNFDVTQSSCRTLDELIDNKIKYLAAIQDSLLPEEEIGRMFDLYLSRSSTTFREAIYKDHKAYETARAAFREQQLILAMEQKIMSGIGVTPQEVRSFANQQQLNGLPEVPETVRLCQFTIVNHPSSEMEKYLKNLLLEYRKQLETFPGPFEKALVLRDQPGLRQHVGSYTVSLNDKSLDVSIRNEIMKLKKGEISQPIQSRFGFHLLRVEERNPQTIVFSNFMLLAPVSEKESAMMLDKMNSFRAAYVRKSREGKIGEPAGTKDIRCECTSGPLQVSTLTNEIADLSLANMISKLEPGDMSMPVPFEEPGNSGFQMTLLLSRSPAHPASMEHDYEFVAALAVETKRNAALQSWINAKRNNYAIEINGSCAQLFRGKE